MTYGSTGSGGSYSGRQAAAAETEALNAKQAVKQLEDRVERLTLICAAVWDLLRERGKLTEQDLIERIAILDAKDGVADGKMSRKTRPCSKCGRPIAAQHTKCMYCGAVEVPASPFEGV
jgi:hypothetical protein